MHLANGAKGADKIEAKIIEVGIASCIINPVIAAELRHKVETGAGRVKKGALLLLSQMLSAARCVPLDCAAGQEGGLIFSERALKGLSVAMPDALIAGHARHAGLILVSDNEKHFAGIARLKLENWRA